MIKMSSFGVKAGIYKVVVRPIFFLLFFFFFFQRHDQLAKSLPLSFQEFKVKLHTFPFLFPSSPLPHPPQKVMESPSLTLFSIPVDNEGTRSRPHIPASMSPMFGNNSSRANNKCIDNGFESSSDFFLRRTDKDMDLFSIPDKDLQMVRSATQSAPSVTPVEVEKKKLHLSGRIKRKLLRRLSVNDGLKRREGDRVQATQSQGEPSVSLDLFSR